MLRHIYTDERTRSRAVGVWAGVSGLALAVGPVVGGALVGVWDWRAIFWFNVAFGLAALVAAVVVLPESSDPDAHRVDIPGTVLAAAALTAFVFAVIGGEDSGFGSRGVLALLAISAAAAVAFFWWESRAAHPLLDLRYLRVPRFLTANVVAFCAYFATFAVSFFTALYLEEVVGDSGYQIALVFLPMTALMIAASLLAGRWTSAVSPRWSISAGCLLFSTGLLLTSLTLSPSPPYAPLALALALTGLGIGTTVVPITSSALCGTPGAIWHGGFGDEHQPRDRGRDRRRDPGRAGQRAVALGPDQQAEAPRHPGQFPVDSDQRDRDRDRAVQRSDLVGGPGR